MRTYKAADWYNAEWETPSISLYNELKDKNEANPLTYDDIRHNSQAFVDIRDNPRAINAAARIYYDAAKEHKAPKLIRPERETGVSRGARFIQGMRKEVMGTGESIRAQLARCVGTQDEAEFVRKFTNFVNGEELEVSQMLSIMKVPKDSFKKDPDLSNEFKRILDNASEQGRTALIEHAKQHVREECKGEYETLREPAMLDKLMKDWQEPPTQTQVEAVVQKYNALVNPRDDATSGKVRGDIEITGKLEYEALKSIVKPYNKTTSFAGFLELFVRFYNSRQNKEWHKLREAVTAREASGGSKEGGYEALNKALNAYKNSSSSSSTLISIFTAIDTSKQPELSNTRAQLPLPISQLENTVSTAGPSSLRELCEAARGEGTFQKHFGQDYNSSTFKQACSRLDTLLNAFRNKHPKKKDKDGKPILLIDAYSSAKNRLQTVLRDIAQGTGNYSLGTLHDEKKQKDLQKAFISTINCSLEKTGYQINEETFAEDLQDPDKFGAITNALTYVLNESNSLHKGKFEELTQNLSGGGGP